MTPDTNKERAEFEAWYASQSDAPDEPERTYELDDAGMIDLTKDCLWEGWQARAAKAPAAPTQAEPMFWVRLLRDGMYEGPVHHKSVGGKVMRDEKPDEWHPLYTTPHTTPAAIRPTRIERKVYKGTPEHREYLAARFPRNGGSPSNSFEWQGHRWAYYWTSFNDAGEYDLIYRNTPEAAPVAPAPQPAGFVLVPVEPTQEMEGAEIRKALDDAATALETISRIAGRDQYMLGMMDVRLYAASRAKVARDAQAAQPEGGANANS